MDFIKKIIRNNAVMKRGGLLIGAAILCNFLNFLYNAYLGRALTIENFALIAFLGSVLSLTDIIIGALKSTTVFKTAFFLGKNKKPAVAFWHNLRIKAKKVSVLVTVCWILLSPFIASYFNISSLLPVITLAPVWVLMIYAAVDGGYLTGNLQLGFMAIAGIVEATIKLLSAYILVSIGLGEYAYLAILFSALSLVGMISLGRERIKRKTEVMQSDERFPFKFYLSNIMTRISVVAYLTLDVILAKHFLAPEHAGQYALLSLAGKIVFLAGSFFSQFLTPIISNFEGKGRNSRNAFSMLLIAITMACFSAYLFVGAFGYVTIPILFGERAQSIIPYVHMYSLSMVCFTISTAIITFHQIKGKGLLPFVGLIFALVQIILIFHNHNSVESIANTMAWLGFSVLAIVLVLDILNSKISFVLSNIRDFFDLLSPIELQKGSNGIGILIYNWRDIKHIWAGGAEVYINEVAKKWADEGNAVLVFCGNDGHNLRDEIVNGVRVVRRGGFYTVYLWAAIYYLLKFRGKFDVIVDSENGIPFFSSLYSTKPVALLIHHVHQAIFLEHMRPPFSYLGKFIEGKIMPFVYKHNVVVTVSESSKKEIIKAGIAKEENIRIINPGIKLPSKQYKKTDYPSVVYLGRLKPYKNVDIAIKAFARIANKFPSARFQVVGDGESINSLRELARNLNISSRVSFTGRVSEQQKVRVLSKSWVAIQPSTIEGWGITVIEANACKTPVIASNTNGLRDSIIDGKTGILAKTKDIQNFASSMEYLLTNKNVRTEMSENAYKWSQKFDWGRSSANFLLVLLQLKERKVYFFPQRIGYLFNRVMSAL